MLPDNVTVLPPAVAIAPDNPVTAGAVYDTVWPVDTPLAWEPTVTIQTSDAPTPATLAQRISVSAVFTTQPVAEYVVPLVPYVAATTLPLVGPKFVPVSVIVAPPLVDKLLPPATTVMAGAA